MKFTLGILTLFIGLNLQAQVDPTIIEVDGKPVTKSEFLQIYLKNNNDPKYDQASLDEYMELFKRFKLKVAEAEALGYDTIPKLKRELEGYRNQLATPYLVDSAQNEKLVKEAYNRMTQEVRASHILLNLRPDATGKDTLEIYNKLIGFKARIEKGEKFEDIARLYSQDPSAKDNGGDLGYFTAFQMVYPFEEAAYTTAVGTVSNPVRTRFGYHLVYVTDKRDARGTIKTAHLMIAARKDQATKEEVQDAEKRINEIYDLVKKGDDFDELVKRYSEDPSSSGNGGVLPVFGTGSQTRMVTEFEDAAFNLKNDGDISTPVQTAYGYHIIKRLEYSPVKSYNEMEKELQSRVNRDERSKITQNSYITKLKGRYGYQDKSKKTKKWFNQNIDSTYKFGKWNADGLKKNKPMFKYDGVKYGQQAFADYLENNFRTVPVTEVSAIVDYQFNEWVKSEIMAAEMERLPKLYPAYKALATEYHDGILLYEIMSDKVWNKAMSDTTGLKNFYEANKANYQWGDRIDAYVFECTDEGIAAEVLNKLKIDSLSNKEVVDLVNASSSLNVRGREGKFEIQNTPYLKGRGFEMGINKAYVYDGKVYVIRVKEKIPAGQKQLSEARGLITSDYQNQLEKEWLEELEKKHQVKINKEVLYSLGK